MHRRHAGTGAVQGAAVAQGSTAGHAGPCRAAALRCTRTAWAIAALLGDASWTVGTIDLLLLPCGALDRLHPSQLPVRSSSQAIYGTFVEAAIPAGDAPLTGQEQVREGTGAVSRQSGHCHAWRRSLQPGSRHAAGTPARVAWSPMAPPMRPEPACRVSKLWQPPALGD